jgi:hypothetical protein
MSFVYAFILDFHILWTQQSIESNLGLKVTGKSGLEIRRFSWIFYWKLNSIETVKRPLNSVSSLMFCIIYSIKLFSFSKFVIQSVSSALNSDYLISDMFREISDNNIYSDSLGQYCSDAEQDESGY